MSTDVRMKGFGPRTSVADALAWIDGRSLPLPVEQVSFRRALGRVLAADLVAPGDVPPYPRSAMDGYAVRAADLPGPLEVVGEILAAGQLPHALGHGQAARIMTGARVPDGADQVVMVEDSSLSGVQVTLRAAAHPGAHILGRGEDLRQGSVVLHKGRVLGPEDLAMAIALSALELPVYRAPRVRVVPTGSELVPPGTAPQSGQIVESNSTMLAALAARDGAEATVHPIVPDDLAMLRRALSEPGADVVVVTGGSSVGKEDYPPLIVRELGELPIHGIDVRPASPTGLGRVGDALVVLAPGYPVASWVAWDLFVRPMVQRLAMRPVALPYRTTPVELAHPLKKPRSRVEVQRVRIEGGRARVLPGGAALLSTITGADGFLLLPAGEESWKEGATLTAHLYR